MAGLRRIRKRKTRDHKEPEEKSAPTSRQSEVGLRGEEGTEQEANIEATAAVKGHGAQAPQHDKDPEHRGAETPPSGKRKRPLLLSPPTIFDDDRDPLPRSPFLMSRAARAVLRSIIRRQPPRAPVRELTAADFDRKRNKRMVRGNWEPLQTVTIRDGVEVFTAGKRRGVDKGGDCGQAVSAGLQPPKSDNAPAKRRKKQESP